MAGFDVLLLDSTLRVITYGSTGRVTIVAGDGRLSMSTREANELADELKLAVEQARNATVVDA